MSCCHVYLKKKKEKRKRKSVRFLSLFSLPSPPRHRTAVTRMDTDLTRQYTPPIPVSPATLSLYRQYRPVMHGPQLGHLPESHHLLSIKADLEQLLEPTETRLIHLKHDLHHLQRNVKIHDTKVEPMQSKKVSCAGKSMHIVLDKIRKRQDASGDKQDPLAH
ncbi:hypothetical protein BDF14DRAFT_1836603 [Spinellus fusiger]|nr:hypothetical protein BDF14DRAFT_1836603 [Spinellus fusiger]